MKKKFVKPHQFTCEECGKGFDRSAGNPWISSQPFYYGIGGWGLMWYTTAKECPFCQSTEFSEYIRGEDRLIGETYRIVRVRKVKA